MSNTRLNICLHNIVPRQSDIKSIYDLTVEQLLKLNNSLQKYVNKKFNEYTLFFDDGYRSFNTIVACLDLGLDKTNIRCAIIVDELNMNNRIGIDDVKSLSSSGYGIDAHGMSHAALAYFSDYSTLLPTPLGGRYENSPKGRSVRLTEKEVLYQVLESQKKLEKITELPVNNFILPYGLYNREVVDIILHESRYKRVYTCDAAFDCGQPVAPRLLITQQNINNINSILQKLNKEADSLFRYQR